MCCQGNVTNVFSLYSYVAMLKINAKKINNLFFQPLYETGIRFLKSLTHAAALEDGNTQLNVKDEASC